MRYGKNILILAVLIGTGLFFYIRQVNSDRASGISVLIRQPERGDIYKIKYTSAGGSRSVRYFKVAEVNEDNIAFFRGKLSGWNASDVFLDDYETDRMVHFSPDDLELMQKGKFSNGEMKNATLIEIERRSSRLPENSL
jgi:hypothetical protein